MRQTSPHALPAPVDITWKAPAREHLHNLETKRHDQGRVGDLVTVAAWALAALRERGPYPVLVLAGEQGSAKRDWPGNPRAFAGRLRQLAGILRRRLDVEVSFLRQPTTRL